MNKLIMTIVACYVAFAALTLSAATWTDPATSLTWTYTVADGSATIGAAEYAGDVEIPKTIGGIPVSAIGESAFEGCTRLRSVLIPPCVLAISARAFRNCTALEYVEIRNPTVVIAGDAFDGCTGVLAVVVPTALQDAASAAFADSPAATVYRADRIDANAAKASITAATLTGIAGTSEPGVCRMTFDAKLSGGVDANFDSSKVKIIRAASTEEIAAKTVADATDEPIQGGITARDTLGVTLRVKIDKSGDDAIEVEDDPETPSSNKRYFKAVKNR